MARRRRSRFSGRGAANLPANVSPPDVAPDPFIQPFELEEADRRAPRPYDRVGRSPEALVYRPRLMAEQVVRAPLARFKSRFRMSPWWFAPKGSFGAYKALRGLSMPRQTIECVRRKIRKEALFAMRLIGFRGSSPGTRSRYTGKYYRRTAGSSYRCV